VTIGRDHIASTVNTLVLAYAGASLPLLLLFTQAGRSLVDVAAGELVAVEVVRTLVGSIGLVAAVPITTALAALVVTRGTDGGGPDEAGRAAAHRSRPPARRRRPESPPAAPEPATDEGPPTASRSPDDQSAWERFARGDDGAE
jgi:hypothetical protein